MVDRMRVERNRFHRRAATIVNRASVPATTKVVGADACPLFVPKHPAAADGAWQRLLSASAFEAVASCQQWKSSGIFQAADDRFFSARNHV
jgi:hypothetical protein